MEFWALRHDSLNGGKDFSSGRVELQIRDRFDLTDFAEVAYQTKEVIAHQYIPKAERSLSKESTRYLSKQEKLLQLAHHVYLLKRLEVWVREWRDRHKGIFTVEMSNLWDVYNIKQIVQI
ncbi:MAG: hypothetical protein SWZ49_04170 [Cyanobacteriota bacterium]|nr:hypothetical protein [Cyanobacteriota bacterium]